MSTNRRKWLIQNSTLWDSPSDTAIINYLLRRDALVNLGETKQVESAKEYGKDWLPVGTIEFVSEWLKVNYSTEIVTLEVPKTLRREHFLKRSYQFIKRDELWNYYNNAKGRYFIKNVSQPKEFNSSLYEGRIPKPDTLTDGAYLVADWLDIASEYRIFVHEDEILAVQHYLGRPLVFPDAEVVKKMVSDYREDNTRPRAYTLDVAITKQWDTVILEVHPFVSCGLYGFQNRDLPDMLEKGLQYYTERGGKSGYVNPY